MFEWYLRRFAGVGPIPYSLLALASKPARYLVSLTTLVGSGPGDAPKR